MKRFIGKLPVHFQAGNVKVVTRRRIIAMLSLLGMLYHALVPHPLPLLQPIPFLMVTLKTLNSTSPRTQTVAWLQSQRVSAFFSVAGHPRRISTARTANCNGPDSRLRRIRTRIRGNDGIVPLIIGTGGHRQVQLGYASPRATLISMGSSQLAEVAGAGAEVEKRGESGETEERPATTLLRLFNTEGRAKQPFRPHDKRRATVNIKIIIHILRICTPEYICDRFSV